MESREATMADMFLWIVLVLLLGCFLQSMEAVNSVAKTTEGGIKSDIVNYSVASQDKVTDLPGQPQVGFGHYAGYVTVNEDHGRALFYWFFEATSDGNEKPLVLWLNGGPGCSSVGYGATEEIGPFLVDVNGTGLILNPYSWNHEANLLFVESPVGVGFSYSNTSSDYNILGDNITAQDTYNFIQNWLNIFPTYRNHDFFITGESYAGKYVPELAELIHDLNNVNNSSDKGDHYINLKGFMVGNPETHDGHDWQGLVDYAWSHAVVSDETHDIIKQTCDFFSNDTWSNKNCSQAVDEVFKQYKEIDLYSLYTPVCIQDLNVSSTKAKMSGSAIRRMRAVENLGGYDPCLDDYAKIFYNRLDVQRALHAINGAQTKNWSICNDQIFQNWSDSRANVLPIYQKLITAGLRIWVYSGDTDGRVSVLSTRYSLNALGLPTKKLWRPWYHGGQVAGWVHEYEGLTYATFRGAGHEVPIFNPSGALAFLGAFLSGTSLPNQR